MLINMLMLDASTWLSTTWGCHMLAASSVGNQKTAYANALVAQERSAWILLIIHIWGSGVLFHREMQHLYSPITTCSQMSLLSVEDIKLISRYESLTISPIFLATRYGCALTPHQGCHDGLYDPWQPIDIHPLLKTTYIITRTLYCYSSCDKEDLAWVNKHMCLSMSITHLTTKLCNHKTHHWMWPTLTVSEWLSCWIMYLIEYKGGISCESAVEHLTLISPKHWGSRSRTKSSHGPCPIFFMSLKVKPRNWLMVSKTEKKSWSILHIIPNSGQEHQEIPHFQSRLPQGMPPGVFVVSRCRHHAWPTLSWIGSKEGHPSRKFLSPWGAWLFPLIG